MHFHVAAQHLAGHRHVVGRTQHDGPVRRRQGIFDGNAIPRGERDAAVRGNDRSRVRDAADRRRRHVAGGRNRPRQRHAAAGGQLDATGGRRHRAERQTVRIPQGDARAGRRHRIGEIVVFRGHIHRIRRRERSRRPLDRPLQHDASFRRFDRQGRTGLADRTRAFHAGLADQRGLGVARNRPG